MEKVILSIESLNVEKDDNKLLKDISFNFIEGKRYILLGEIGSGKSVLCKIITSNFDNRYKISGKILYKDEDLLKFSDDEKRKISGSEISILSSDMRLHPYTEIGKQLEDILLAHNLFKKSKKNIDILLEKIGLSRKILSEFPFKLKEHDIQKIMILITLLLSPNIAIFIHSFRGFDSEIQKTFLELILEKVQTNSITPIFITHDLSFADKYGDEILIFKDGEIIESGEKNMVFKNPQNEYTKKFLNSTSYFKIKNW